nr:FAD-dependent oxidoreductase [methane-oxidizing endosymbiont of Gigantopelta aegis]
MDADVLIVGAGLIGTSTALQLSMRGYRCIVVDKDSPGRHASGANAGGLRLLNRDPAEIPLSVAATQMWHSVEIWADSDCDARFPGGMRVAENAADMEKLEQRAAQVQSLGYRHEELIGKKSFISAFQPWRRTVSVLCSAKPMVTADPIMRLQPFATRPNRLGLNFYPTQKSISCDKLTILGKYAHHRGAFPAQSWSIAPVPGPIN